MKVSKVDEDEKALPKHGWKYSDWLELCELEDDITAEKHISPSMDTSTTLTASPYDADPRLPSLNSVLKFNIRELRNQAQSSSSLLQRFLPDDEPEYNWDHSPEFLIHDNRRTWGETLDVDEEVNQAIAPRNLFQATESPSDTLTSTDSEDSIFFNPSGVQGGNSSALVRSDVKRIGMLRRPRTQAPNLVQAPTEEAHFVAQPNANTRDSFVICNLSQDEIDLEQTDELSCQVVESASPPVQTHTDDGINFPTASPRAKRSNRRVIDYQHLHAFGFQEREEREKRKSHANQDRFSDVIRLSLYTIIIKVSWWQLG